MEPLPITLRMPSFLFGPYATVEREALKEGRRCADEYQTKGLVTLPREMREVQPGEVVIARGVVDFQRERPAWRLYLLSSVIDGWCEAVGWRDAFQVSDRYEISCRETAWGALDYGISYHAPMSAERVALRLKAVLRAWDTLQVARYLFSSPGTALTLEELMMAACDWVLTAWCPGEGGPVRRRLEAATDRMARATKEDSIEAILRQLPPTLPFASSLKHRDVLGTPAFWRKRLATLAPDSFERLSAALPAHLLEQLTDWDQELEQD